MRTWAGGGVGGLNGIPRDTEPYPLGNTNGDEAINAKDSATVLIAAARLGTGGATGFTDEHQLM